MNKKLISLAVAAAVAAPMLASAETTLYGRLDTMLNYSDGDTITYTSVSDPGTTSEVDGKWGVNSNTTRMGVKGSEDLGNGLKAIFQAEWAFNSADGGSTQSPSSFNNRLAYAGLAGSWGTAAIGRQWTPYYGAVNKTDIFNNSTYNAYYIGTFRTGNAISYKLPNFNGFSGAIAGVLTDSDDENDVDSWNAALTYDNGPASVGFGYNHRSSTSTLSKDKTWGLAGSWTFSGMGKIIAQYEAGDKANPFLPTDTNDYKAWAIAGEYYMGNHTFRALYGNTDWDIDDGDTWALGWQYAFSKRTRTYVEYGEPTGRGSQEVGSSGDLVIGDGKVFTFGLRHYF